MLSEGYQILRNLENIDFDIPISHPDVKKPGKNPGYRVGLDTSGLPQTVEEIDRESMGKLWYHRKGNHNAFPIIRIQHALLSVPEDDPFREQFGKLKKSDRSQRITLLRKVLESRPFLLSELNEKAWNRLRIKADKWLNIFAQVDKRYLALYHMLLRFTLDVPISDFLYRICYLLVQQLERGQLQDVSLVEKVLIGSPESKGTAKAGVPIVLDVMEPDYYMPVADPRMGAYVSDRLRAIDNQKPDGICAFQGKLRPLLKKRFPEPNLGTLGETKLFSKYKATPCEFRYIKKPVEWDDVSNSFPICQQLAANIADSLKSLTRPSLEGKTWRMLANGKWEGRGRAKRERKDLLIIYCEGQPVISEEAANIFGSSPREKLDQFENDAKALCDALEGIINRYPKSRLHILLIGKADKEKKKISMHMSPKPLELLGGAKRWKTGALVNLPTIYFPLPPEETGHKTATGYPFPPYPDRVVRLLSSKWIREGTEELKLGGPKLRQVLDVMLRSDEKWEHTANNLLELTNQRIGPLLVGIGAAFHSRDKKHLDKYNLLDRKTALGAVGLLGILLDALGRRKEAYMNETAFQLGRLLSLADTLHREYCMYVRKGNIPSQLLGNALMSVAADNPEDAIDRLRGRINIYQAWSKKVSGEEYRLAKWAVGQMGEICNTISRPLPTVTDQSFRAELLLGYLARSSKENK